MPNEDAILTDQQLIAEVWVGKKSGNLWRAVTVVKRDGVRYVKYVKPSGESFEVSYPQFMSRFRPARKDELWQAIMENRADGDGETTEEVYLTEPDHRHELDHMVLHRAAIEQLRIGLNKITRSAELEAAWNLSKIEPKAKKCVLNLHGPPGVGKTMAALCVAKLLGKKMLQVDYAQCISKYPGDTAKAIKAAFAQAKSLDAVLFWDEADAMMGKRIDLEQDNQACSQSVNQNRNVLLNQLDKFDGVVIMCTNYFKNFDEALLRRIAQSIRFDLPSEAMLVKLYKLHLPCPDRVDITDAEWEILAEKSRGFSGGDVLNAVLNGINRASMAADQAEWRLDHDSLETEIARIQEAKEFHAGVE